MASSFNQSGKTPAQVKAEFLKFRAELTTIVGVTAVNTFKQSFIRQGFIKDRTIERWKKRKVKKGQTDSSRKILVMSGRLKRAIRIAFKSYNEVAVGNDVPYAKIHNEGGTINNTVNVKAHRRRDFRNDIYSLKTRKRTKKSSLNYQMYQYVSAHQRRMNLKIAQRQFMGNSKFLHDRLEAIFVERLKKILA
jgi:phage gpG-like protein